MDNALAIDWSNVLKKILPGLSVTLANCHSRYVEEYDDNDYSMFEREFAEVTVKLGNGAVFTVEEQNRSEWLDLGTDESQRMRSELDALLNSSEFLLAYNANRQEFMKYFYSEFLDTVYKEYSTHGRR